MQTTHITEQRMEDLKKSFQEMLADNDLQSSEVLIMIAKLYMEFAPENIAKDGEHLAKYVEETNFVEDSEKYKYQHQLLVHIYASLYLAFGKIDGVSIIVGNK